MIPQLINTNNRILGSLTDCTRLYVTEERNGIYEAEFDIPVNSSMHNKIKIGHFIYAKPDDLSENQKFRIYKRIYNPIDKTTVFYCEHIRYKLAGIPVAPDTYSGTPASILSEMLTSVKSSAEFTVWSDISAVKDVNMEIPSTVGAMLAGQEGSILDVFGGEYKFDNYTVKLYQNRGQEKKTEIRYRKNLTGFTCTEDTTSTYTHVYPYYRNEDGVYVELDSKIITLANASGLPFENCYMLDLSAEFDTPPTKVQLQAKANTFINANDLDTVSRHYKVSFIPLWQTAEYKNLAVLERCGLCDTVSIVHDNETVKAKIIKTVYDALNERYVSMELGNAVSSFAQTVQQSVRQVENNLQSTKSFLQQSIERQTKRITGNRGGYVVMNDDNQDGCPDEILIMNDLSIGSATKVWRANLSGIGYSNHGYAGPFELAMTMDGEINASMITTGSLDASIIRTGVLNADLITAGSMSADRITSGELDASRVTVKNLNASLITSGELDAGQVTVKNLNASLITSGTIDASQINIINLNANSIVSGEISANRIKTGVLQSSNSSTSLNMQTGKLQFELDNARKLFLSGTGLRMEDANNNLLASIYTTSYGSNTVSQMKADMGEFNILRFSATSNQTKFLLLDSDNEICSTDTFVCPYYKIKNSTGAEIGSFKANINAMSVLTSDIANVSTGNITNVNATSVTSTSVNTNALQFGSAKISGNDIEVLALIDGNGNAVKDYQGRNVYVLGYTH